MKTYLPLITLFVLSVVLLFSNIWGQPIYILDEAKNATCAREMLDRGDLIVPTFNDQLRSDKPPLHYHFMMLAYKLFGVNEFAARFFSSFFGMLTVLFTYLFAKRFLNEKVGIAAGVILLSSLYFNLQFHFAVPDPYLIFFIALALGSFFMALEEHRPRLFYLFYIAMAMGVLSKGPVAIALPGLILLLFLIFSGQFTIHKLKNMRIPTGIVLFLGFALPWYVLVGEATDNEWLESFFFKHNVGRFSKTMEGHGGPFFITPLFALLGLLPFSMFAPQALYITWKQRKSPDRILLFSLIVTAVFVGFFSISQTKLPNYIAPMFPFFALILAYFITGLDELKMRQYKTSISYSVYFLISLLLPIAAYIAIPTEKSIIGLEYLAFFLVLLPIGGLAALIFHHKRDLLKANLAIALSFMLTSLCVFYVVYPTLYKDNPVSLSLQQMDTSKPIAYYKRFNPSFAFYLKRPIPKFNTKKEVQAFFEKHPEGYLITERKRFKDISDVADFQIITERKDTFERPVTMVLKLKKTTR